MHASSLSAAVLTAKKAVLFARPIEAVRTARPSHTSAPHRKTVVNTLRAEQPALRDRGITSVTLFGSVARDAADRASDIDLLVDFAHTPSLIDISQLEADLATLLGHDVQVTLASSLRRASSAINAAITKDGIRIF